MVDLHDVEGPVSITPDPDAQGAGFNSPNQFLVDLIEAANDRGYIVFGYQSHPCYVELHPVKIELPAVTLRQKYGLAVEGLIRELPRGDGR